MAKTHSSLTFDDLCEEAFGELGLHPWEFYEYSLNDYLLKRKGYNRKRKEDYQLMLTASMLPYMSKEERVKIVTRAFKEENGKVISMRERYEAAKERFADELNAPPMKILKKNG